MDAWYEILVEASREELAELLAAAETAGHGRPLCDRDLKLDLLSLSDRVRDLLGGEAHHLVFATAPQARALLRAARAHGRVRVEELRRIEEGHFTFRAEAFSEAVAAEIRRALREDVPAGVTVEVEETEERDPRAKGVELFAPAHDYVYRARGTVAGSPPGVLAMHLRLDELDFVHVGRLEVSGPAIGPDELSA